MAEIDEAIQARLPERFRLIVEWSQYLNIDVVLSMAHRDVFIYFEVSHPARREWGTPAPDFYPPNRFLGIAKSAIPSDLLTRTSDYKYRTRRGVVFGPDGIVPLKHRGFFTEPDGRPTTLLDLRMAIWRASLHSL